MDLAYCTKPGSDMEIEISLFRRDDVGLLAVQDWGFTITG